MAAAVEKAKSTGQARVETAAVCFGMIQQGKLDVKRLFDIIKENGL